MWHARQQQQEQQLSLPPPQQQLLLRGPVQSTSSAPAAPRAHSPEAVAVAAASALSPQTTAAGGDSGPPGNEDAMDWQASHAIGGSMPDPRGAVSLVSQHMWQLNSLTQLSRCAGIWSLCYFWDDDV
jgi:hypothetical protein